MSGRGLAVRIAAAVFATLVASAARADQLVRIPGPGGAALVARICPSETQTGRFIVLNHGSPVRPEDRPGMVPAACGNEAVRWFTSRGWTVLAPMRRGFGQTGGAFAETSGGCTTANFERAGGESAEDVFAGVAAARFRGARTIVVVGQSAGGWAAMALSARNPRDVAGYINFAGGRGGHRGGVANSNCRPERLVAAAGAFGATARQPTLWFYTANDSFFDPDLAAAMHRAYTGAGGMAEMQALPPFGTDGHSLLYGRGGSAVWGPAVERFLASLR